MTNWRDHHLVDADGGPDHSVWYPDVAGHFIDPRVRVRILENPDLTIVMVHRGAMASANPCWLVLTSEGAAKASSLRIDGDVRAIQMAPDVLGTVACAWLETEGKVVIDSDDREGIVWEKWK